jgi:hypothetical protein
MNFGEAYDSVSTLNGFVTFVPMKLVRLIKMCVNETYSKFHIGKNLSDEFPTQNALKLGHIYSHFFSILPYNMLSERSKKIGNEWN